MDKERKVQERTISNRRKILDAARVLFQTKGYYKTNTKEIAKTAGVATGSFYNYFTDKSSVFFEIVKEYIEKNYQILTDMLSNLGENPDCSKDILTDYVHVCMSRAYENELTFKDYESVVIGNPDFNVFVNQLNLQIMNQLLDYIKSSQIIKKRTNPLVMSQMSFFLVQGISEYLCKLPKDADRAEYEKQFIDIICWYIFGE